MIRQSARKSRGLTMVEIMIAVVIFGLAFIPMMNLFQSGSRDTVKLKNLTLATVLAREIVETVRVHPFDLVIPSMQLYLFEEDSTFTGGTALVCDGNQSGPFNELGPQGYFDPYLGRFRAAVTIEPLVTSGSEADAACNNPTKLKKVVATIYWRDASSDTTDKEISIKTIISRPTPNPGAGSTATTTSGDPINDVQYGY